MPILEGLLECWLGLHLDLSRNCEPAEGSGRGESEGRSRETDKLMHMNMHTLKQALERQKDRERLTERGILREQLGVRVGRGIGVREKNGWRERESEMEREMGCWRGKAMKETDQRGKTFDSAPSFK